jgi:hypothetical protein
MELDKEKEKEKMKMKMRESIDGTQKNRKTFF